MHAGLLAKMFGTDRRWHGPCTVIVDADAAIQSTGGDSIIQSGTKVYAPRLISGRVVADSACLFGEAALLLVQSQRIRQATGEDLYQQTLIVVDPSHVVAVEFPDTAGLRVLGIEPPPHTGR